MDGDALMYTTIDLEALAESGGQFTELPLEFGFVLETSNAQASQRIFDFVTREMKQNQSSGVRVGSATINDVRVTTIHFDIPNGADMLEYELMMGVTDEVAFIASNEVTQFITAGRGESLLDNADYNEASALYLPGTKQLFYASDEGMITVGAGIAGLLFLGENTDMDFPVPGLQMYDSGPQTISYQPGSTAFVLELARSLLHSASVTGTIGNGFQVSRLVFSLE
jgi:hypothetical protein